MHLESTQHHHFLFHPQPPRSQLPFVPYQRHFPTHRRPYIFMPETSLMQQQQPDASAQNAVPIYAQPQPRFQSYYPPTPLTTSIPSPFSSSGSSSSFTANDESPTSERSINDFYSTAAGASAPTVAYTHHGSIAYAAGEQQEIYDDYWNMSPLDEHIWTTRKQQPSHHHSMPYPHHQHSPYPPLQTHDLHALDGANLNSIFALSDSSLSPESNPTYSPIEYHQMPQMLDQGHYRPHSQAELVYPSPEWPHETLPHAHRPHSAFNMKQEDNLSTIYAEEHQYTPSPHIQSLDYPPLSSTQSHSFVTTPVPRNIPHPEPQQQQQQQHYSPHEVYYSPTCSDDREGQHHIPERFVHPVELSPVLSTDVELELGGYGQSQGQGCDPRFVTGGGGGMNSCEEGDSGKSEGKSRFVATTEEDEGGISEREVDHEGDDEADGEGEGDDDEYDVDYEDEDDDRDGEYIFRSGRKPRYGTGSGEGRNLRVRRSTARYNPYSSTSGSNSSPTRNTQRRTSTHTPSYSSDTTTDSSFQQSRRRPRAPSHLPIPIPVPNLTKKSRGRRVPTVSSLEHGPGRRRGSAAASMIVGHEGDISGRRGGAGAGGKGERLYLCKVAGCGKCFARGEHLKRHVRSIHTYEKPHKCPYPGCGKDFSRHDNLGQHMRVHKGYVPSKNESAAYTPGSTVP